VTAFLFFILADWTVNVGFRVEEHNYIARKVCASSLVKKLAMFRKQYALNAASESIEIMKTLFTHSLLSTQPTKLIHTLRKELSTNLFLNTPINDNYLLVNFITK